MFSGATCLVSNGNNISSRVSPTMKARQILKRDKRPWPVLVCSVVSRALLLVTSKADKLPLETEPVACDNNTILTFKPGDQILSRHTQLIIIVIISYYFVMQMKWYHWCNTLCQKLDALYIFAIFRFANSALKKLDIYRKGMPTVRMILLG